MKKPMILLLLTIGASLAMLSVPALAYSEQTPQEQSPSMGKVILIALAVGLVIATIVILVLRSKMKTAKFQRGAANYLLPGSYRLTGNGNYYLYSTVTKIPRPQNNSSSRGRR